MALSVPQPQFSCLHMTHCVLIRQQRHASHQRSARVSTSELCAEHTSQALGFRVPKTLEAVAGRRGRRNRGGGRGAGCSPARLPSCAHGSGTGSGWSSLPPTGALFQPSACVCVCVCLDGISRGASGKVLVCVHAEVAERQGHAYTCAQLVQKRAEETGQEWGGKGGRAGCIHQCAPFCFPLWAVTSQLHLKVSNAPSALSSALSARTGRRRHHEPPPDRGALTHLRSPFLMTNNKHAFLSV